MRSYVPIIVGSLILALTPSGLGHHGDRGLFDETRTVEMQGVVTAWRFVNPHPILRVEVTWADGENVLWNVNFGPPAVSALRRRGFSVETFQPGDVITVKGHPATAPGALSIKVQGPESDVTREDGTQVP